MAMPSRIRGNPAGDRLDHNHELGPNLWYEFADLGGLQPDALELGSKSPDEAADVLAQRFLRSNLRGRDRGQSHRP